MIIKHLDILLMQDAIASNSFDADVDTMENGNIEAGFTESNHIIEGEVRVGAQEHFYLEPIAHRVIPKNEDGCLEVYSTIQSPKFIQVH